MNEPVRRPPRRLLGKAHSWTDRVRVFWTDEALEVDQADNYEIRRRRVFFDEILLVTLHSGRGGVLPWIVALMGLPFGLFSLALTGDEADVGRVFLAMAVALGVLAVVLALLPVWVVTVFGKRTRARMFYRMREGKARAVYAEVCRAAGEAQRAIASRSAGVDRPRLDGFGVVPAAGGGQEAEQGDQQQRGDSETPPPGGMNE